MLPPRSHYVVEAIAKSDEPGDPGFAFFLDLWTDAGPAQLHLEGELHPTGDRFNVRSATSCRSGSTSRVNGGRARRRSCSRPRAAAATCAAALVSPGAVAGGAEDALPRSAAVRRSRLEIGVIDSTSSRSTSSIPLPVPRRCPARPPRDEQPGPRRLAAARRGWTRCSSPHLPAFPGPPRRALASPGRWTCRFLRRHRGLRPHAEARPARDPAAGRRGRILFDCGEGTQHQLLRSDRPAGARRDLHHPPAPRSLARAAGDDQDLRHARSRAAAGGVRPARAQRLFQQAMSPVIGRTGYPLH